MVERRILSRRLCSRCGLDCNVISLRPPPYEVYDVCGGRLVQRPDDTPRPVQARLRDYHAKIRPILDLFARRRVVAQAAISEHLGVQVNFA